MVITYSRVWVNLVVRLPILLGSAEQGKINVYVAFAPENLASRDGLSCPVPRQPAHSPHSGLIWCVIVAVLSCEFQGMLL